MFTNVHTFFTTWVFLLILFHKFTSKYFNLLYLAWVTCLVGLYLSYVNPRKYNFTLFDESYELNRADKFILVDMFFHIGVLVFAITMYNSKHKIDNKFIASLSLIILYFATVNTKELYQIPTYELASVFIVVNLLYIIIF